MDQSLDFCWPFLKAGPPKRGRFLLSVRDSEEIFAKSTDQNTPTTGAGAFSGGSVIAKQGGFTKSTGWLEWLEGLGCPQPR